MTRTKVTEEQLSRTFSALVNSDVWRAHLPSFAHVVPEMAAIQGIPDFVACTSSLADLDPVMRARLGQALAQPAVARIAAGLTRSSGQQEDSLLRWTGYSRPVVRKALSVLKVVELIEERNGATYTLSSEFPETFFDLWAFEIKVADWRRALFQALQYKAFANASAVVMPAENAHRAERHRVVFQRLGIGLYSLSLSDGAIHTIITPEKRQPSSRFQQLCAVGRFLKTVSC